MALRVSWGQLSVMQSKWNVVSLRTPFKKNWTSLVFSCVTDVIFCFPGSSVLWEVRGANLPNQITHKIPRSPHVVGGILISAVAIKKKETISECVGGLIPGKKMDGCCFVLFLSFGCTSAALYFCELLLFVVSLGSFTLSWNTICNDRGCPPPLGFCQYF